MKILAIDPGPDMSAYVLWNNKVLAHGHITNTEMRQILIREDYDECAIEMVASYGMAVGASVFNTCRWVGRFEELACKAPMLCYRKDIKMFLCKTMRSKDKDIRQALLNLVGPQGTKDKQGPTYGLKSHTWSALAVAVYAKNKFDAIPCVD